MLQLQCLRQITSNPLRKWKIGFKSLEKERKMRILLFILWSPKWIWMKKLSNKLKSMSIVKQIIYNILVFHLEPRRDVMSYSQKLNNMQRRMLPHKIIKLLIRRKNVVDTNLNYLIILIYMNIVVWDFNCKSMILITTLIVCIC